MTTNALDFDDIIDLLTKADDAYFNSTAPDLMTDSEYDRLKKRAFAMNPSHSYFSRVGSDIRGGKIKLPYTMGSLDQVYEGEILGWFTKYQLMDKYVIITDKLDGISCMLVYRNGELEIAYSRGNGVEGADITRHVKHILKLPKKLAGEDYVVIRGELIMKNDTFEKNWKGKFKNPRVMVAGTMNRTESVKEQIADIDFVAYEIVATSGDSDISKRAQIGHLSDLGFNVVPFEVVKATDKINDKFLKAFLREVRVSSPYELDGIVITADEIKAVRGQRNSVSLNPEHSCKFKVNDESNIVEADVTRVLWEISKSGYLKPRVEIVPVDLFGTTVTYATGFNGKFIRDNGIGTGAKIKITKSGTVIPYITEVIRKAPTTGLPDSSFGDWEWNENDVEIILKNADKNPMVIFKQVLDFVETLNVELLKESSLSKLFDAFNFWGQDYAQVIYTMLDLKQQEWEKAIGSNGIKSYQSLHRRLQQVELATLIGASKYMGVGFGVRKAKSLISGAGSEDAIWNLNAVDIAMMDGFDTKTASSIVKGLKYTKVFLDELISSGYITLVKVVKTTEMDNIQVVMTGFRDPELAAEIEKRGGKVGSGVSKKTTHLLTYDANSNSGKSKKAKELGVKVMTPDDFKDEFNL